jgi:hypothetical protein
VRSHAKAPSAGSNLRQAAGLGHFFRGAGATRGTASGATGGGTPSRGRRSLLAVVTLSFCVLVALTASVASGAVVTEYVKSFGPDGTEATDFERVNGVAVDQGTGAVYVLDAIAGTLHKFTASGQPLNFTGTATYISDNEISGLEPITIYNGAQVAVDSTSHVVYVTEKESVRAFQENGEPAEFTAGPGALTSEIPGFGELNGVAVDANGAIYASDGEAGTVSVYSSAGAPLADFTISQAANLAVAPGGAVYVTRNVNAPQGDVLKFLPDVFPVTSETTYMAGPVIEEPPEKTHYGVGVDPATGDVYVIQSTRVAKYDSSGTLLRYFGDSGEEGELTGAAGQGIVVVAGGERFKFYVGINGSNAESFAKVAIFGQIINPGPPSVESTAVSDVTSSSATLRAHVNPNTFATTYRFEYGLSDCSVSACTSVPLDAAPIGAGRFLVPVSEEVFGLQPGTTYHYRVVAENPEGTTEGPGRTFTTELAALGFQLADNRTWEMVSPPNKHGAVLLGLGPAHIQAAQDGNGITYLSASSVEPHPEGLREVVSVLARRSGSSWSSKDISTPNSRVIQPALGQQNEYKLFSPDLSAALLDPRDGTNLSPEASERAPHLRQNTSPPSYRPLVTGKEGFANVPPGTVFGGGGAVSSVTIQGATPDLDHVLLRSQIALVTDAPSNVPTVYWWADGELKPVSVLPSSEGGAVVGAASPGSSSVPSRNAISQDGSRVFWSSISSNHLYLRDMEAEESMQIDVVQQGAGGGGKVEPIFQGASADGSVVYFTDTQQLTEGASTSGADLYRCEVPLGTPLSGCQDLTNLTTAPPGESAEVQGIVSALSEDGSRAYFVAKGDLDAGQNQLGHLAVSGEPNLYLWQEGEGLRFIATLATEDRPTWGLRAGGGPRVVTPRSAWLSTAISPSGRYLAFMSQLSLTDSDRPEAGNVDVTSGEAVEQVFRYDAVAERLECVSCPPSGASPRGTMVEHFELADPRETWQERSVAATLPQPPSIADPNSPATIYQPRAIFDNGRIFFNAIDSLVPADSNGQWDVYQHEPTGVGDCTASSGGASISRSAGGCVSLISSGTGEEEAGFLDASATGDDVFFLTPAKLSVLDEDKELDVYDARVNGVAATLPPNNECLGEACQPAVIAPDDPTPASAGFKGQGDPKPKARKRCAKNKRLVRRKGKARCVVRKQARKGKASPKGKASKGRRASR